MSNSSLEREPTAAVRVSEAIIGQTLSRADLPNRAHPGRVPGTRELVIGRYPSIVVYDVTPDDVIILHVNHTRQRWPCDED